MALITATHLGTRAGDWSVYIDRRVVAGGDILPFGLYRRGVLDTDEAQPSVSVEIPDMAGAEFQATVFVKGHGFSEQYILNFPSGPVDLAAISLPQDFVPAPVSPYGIEVGTTLPPPGTPGRLFVVLPA